MNVGLSVARTTVPMVVGAFVSLAASAGFEVDPALEADIVVLVGVAAASFYHWLVRVLEERWPVFGWLLGWARRPDYQADDLAEHESIVTYDEQGRVTQVWSATRWRYPEQE